MERKRTVTLSGDLLEEQVKQIVVTANKFDSYILLERNNWRINAKSPLGTRGFRASKGDTINMIAIGADAEQALEQLSLFLDSVS
ncbi:HPr family phosphocarrier protein [Brevibacillus fulvus]|uniref:Catabolite repression HPr-like protein n=1 Tax=Brevibacillus fulvus TaxID=1125967 RepID=A0A938Y135_9BACL|nr:HPr family phosphocarrier protein [Brevibacillus fulvus]MBM7591984.1 catabolite repression HPr-like protein [Brevibacillus fulvus]